MPRIPRGADPEKRSKKIAKNILPKIFDGVKLSPKEILFVSAYCSNGFHQGQAAQAAGYQGSMIKCSQIANQLMKKESVNIAIKQFIDSIIKPFKDRLEYEVLDAYYKRATYKITDFCDDYGNFKPLSEIPAEWICCIDGVEKKYFGKNADRSVTTYQLPNRDTALQMLYKFVMGGESLDPTTPTEARENLQKIFAKAMDADSESRVMKRTTLTVEQEFRSMSTGPGKPKKIKDIDVHASIKE